jgi:putative transposase
LSGDDDELVRVRPLLELMSDWARYLAAEAANEVADAFHRHSRTGRPLGSNDFTAQVEVRLGRVFRPKKPGPKPKDRDTCTRDLFSV